MIDDLVVSSEFQKAKRRNFRLLRTTGLVRSEKKFEQCRQWQIEELGQALYPTASGSALDAIMGFLAWFTLLDDQFDGSRSHRAKRAKVILDDAVALLLDSPPHHSATPAIAGWIPIALNLHGDMPPWWSQRLCDGFRTM